MNRDGPRLAPLVQLAYQAGDRAITRRVRERGFEVNRSHSAVLANIDIETGSRPTTLAERAGVTKQAIAQVVNELEERGLVVRVPDVRDRRAKLVQLSESGRELIATAQSVIADLEKTLLRRVGRNDFQATVKTLGCLVELAADDE